MTILICHFVAQHGFNGVNQFGATLQCRLSKVGLTLANLSFRADCKAWIWKISQKKQCQWTETA